MNTSLSSQWDSWPRAASVAVDQAAVRVRLVDGRELSVPIAWFGFLDEATDAERQEVEIIERGEGIWWDSVDEGVSVPSLLGLSEMPPPDPTLRSYTIDYEGGGEGWVATIRGTSLTSIGSTLATARREVRANLRTYLRVSSLRAAGIVVVDAVHGDVPAAKQ